MATDHPPSSPFHDEEKFDDLDKKEVVVDDAVVAVSILLHLTMGTGLTPVV
ncbi:MAG TPA: hypothetical protein VGO47_10400 [Chlamydiales bacterium]|nr:hypothetical protein [Chlamydiales bacterium]